ncbi:MAG: response regulator [Planctomycetaceae bacterium]|nr:response regulator [Planctomycetaceae bacterium]
MGNEKTVLLIDDEPAFLEPLVDALSFHGVRVLTARTGEEGLEILTKETVNLVSVDVMMDPGESLRGKTSSQHAGLFVCKEIRRMFPGMAVFCISVINDRELIREIQKCGARFLRKGETPLRTVLQMMRASLTGVAYSTDEHDLEF